MVTLLSCAPSVCGTVGVIALIIRAALSVSKVFSCVDFTIKCIYRIFRPITRALSVQKGSEIVKNEHAQYTLERFPTDSARVICTKKGIGKYGIMY